MKLNFTAKIAVINYPTFTYLSWCGLSAPAKTPREIVTKINGVVANVLAMPAARTKLLPTGDVPASMNPEEYARFVADDVAQMISLGKQTHIETVD